MQLYDKHQFEHNGRSYEVRIVTDGQTFWVRAFLNGRPANGYTYSVDAQTQIEALSRKYSEDLIASLIVTAEDDVKTGRWERYAAAVKEAEGAAGSKA
jgi:hypothetical protein